jgi:hypothetical protein
MIRQSVLSISVCCAASTAPAQGFTVTDLLLGFILMTKQVEQRRDEVCGETAPEVEANCRADYQAVLENLGFIYQLGQQRRHALSVGDYRRADELQRYIYEGFAEASIIEDLPDRYPKLVP